MTRRSPSHGFTLIEVIVASTLALMLLTLVTQLFIPALRAWSDGQKRSEVGQSLLVTSNWLQDDILRSAPGSLKLTEDGIFIMKCALGQVEGYDNPFSQLVAYWLEDGDVYRATLPWDDPEAEPSLALSDLQTLKDKRKVATDVTTFDIEIPHRWRVTLHLAIDKMGRTGELRTAFSSVYAPLDLELAEANEKAPPPKPVPSS